MENGRFEGGCYYNKAPGTCMCCTGVLRNVDGKVMERLEEITKLDETGQVVFSRNGLTPAKLCQPIVDQLGHLHRLSDEVLQGSEPLSVISDNGAGGKDAS